MQVRVHTSKKKQQTGVENYTSNLVKHLPKHIINNNNPQIIHYPTVVPPILRKPKKKTIITVHDLTPLIYPQFHPFKRVFYFKHYLKRQLNFADKIIAVSECTKNDLITYLNIKKEKITVIHEGVEERFRPTDPPNNYLLFLGTIEPRKNLKRLIKAHNSLNLKEKLVIVGKKGWGKDLPTNEKIIYLDYVKRENLPSLYSKAKLFIYPSLYEGFGLPVLEAMACGCPVITSNVSALNEIAGDAALFIDPNNHQSIAQGIKQVLENNNLRKEMTIKGLQQAKKFSWDRCAKETLKVYEELE